MLKVKGMGMGIQEDSICALDFLIVNYNFQFEISS